MAARVYLSLLPALFALVLSACSPSPAEYAAERTKLAKAEDIMAECRLFALKKGSKEDLEKCRAFDKEDKHCASFPEQKEGCIQFINIPSYSTEKLKCQDISSLKEECILAANSRIPSWFYDFANTFGLGWKKKPWIEQVREFTSEIHIGIVHSDSLGKNFVEGVELAVKEINNKGGVLGRHLVVSKGVTKNSHNSRTFAKKMRDNPKFRAVIGSLDSVNTIPFNSIYESSQLVYLVILASKHNVIRPGNRFIFRLIPNINGFVKAIVKVCVQRNFHKLALLYNRDDYSEEMAKAFRAYAIEQNLTIVFEKSFFEKRENFSDISADMKEQEIDAIFLTGIGSTPLRVVQDMREMGINAPIIGSNSLDSEEFAEGAGKSGHGTILVPTIYNPFASHPENTAFVKDFRKAYGETPNTWAAQGYDAVKLLAYVMEEKAHSTVPANVAAGLRYMPSKNGATGKFAFEKSGELADKPIYFKKLQYKEFVLFKDARQEEEEMQQIEIVDDRIILRPEKPSESAEENTF
ncbi:MAG: ABC transporter substrate-binding protein [Gammaproteobacteria bacterium]|nr:ABC transporter substrate-binding protein [Gammaproteobacteria bacterium]